MEPHPFHRSVGRLIKKHFAPDYTVLMDRACDSDGKHISLFNRTSDAKFRYCDVDILIAVKEEAKVIIEIEESNVKPIQVFGKFFASTFSGHYLGRGRGKDRYRPIAKPVLFIQILDSSKVQEAKSGKPSQWENIERQIKDFLKTEAGIITQYALFQGKQEDYELGEGEAIRMIEAAGDFLHEIS